MGWPDLLTTLEDLITEILQDLPAGQPFLGQIKEALKIDSAQA